MSGFFGTIHPGSPLPAPELLEEISKLLTPHGPDATQIITQPNASFVFAFLRTGPAPQSNSQPTSIDGQTWLIGDVRLDARDDLRRKLDQHGAYISTSVTDEELILHAWHLWGGEAFHQLLGDFSFALWDSSNRRLIAVRDLLGLKPFFYTHSTNQFSFSNTLSMLRLVPEVSATLDPIFVADFLLQERCADSERSAYRDIRRLPPGHTLYLDTSTNNLLLRRYTSFPVEEPLSLQNSGDYIDQFRSLLDQAISERLPHGPTAIFMSGGLDSTSIAALAVTSSGARLQRHDLRAYTSVYRPLLADDEDQYANLVARKFGIPLDVTSPGTSLPYDGLTCLPLPEPCHEPFFHANALHYRRIAAQSRVVLSGYGGDDILIGQAWPHLLNLLRRKKFASVVSIFGGYILRHRKIPPLHGGFRARFRRWAGRAHPTENLPPWLADDFVQRQDLRARWSMLGKADQSAHPLHPAGYAGLCSTFWASALEQEDPAYTGAPLELRAPFLDQRLLRFLLRLPPVPWCMDKELLRLTMLGFLPDEVRLRPKTGLSADGLQFFSESGKWLPSLTNPAKNLSEFVDISRLHTSLKHSRDLWFDLRPVSLDLWLKNVENPNPIR
jgi:asparagine synthase (glutamine-hydrolysing)